MTQLLELNGLYLAVWVVWLQFQLAPVRRHRFVSPGAFSAHWGDKHLLPIDLIFTIFFLKQGTHFSPFAIKENALPSILGEVLREGKDG